MRLPESRVDGVTGDGLTEARRAVGHGDGNLLFTVKRKKLGFKYMASGPRNEQGGAAFDG